MSTLTTLVRIFRSGTLNLVDPSPSMSVEEVKDMYSANYPHLATAVIENPDNPIIEGNSMVYVFAPAPVKTKG